MTGRCVSRASHVQTKSWVSVYLSRQSTGGVQTRWKLELYVGRRLLGRRHALPAMSCSAESTDLMLTDAIEWSPAPSYIVPRLSRMMHDPSHVASATKNQEQQHQHRLRRLLSTAALTKQFPGTRVAAYIVDQRWLNTLVVYSC